jgi:hypothetical protein
MIAKGSSFRSQPDLVPKALTGVNPGRRAGPERRPAAGAGRRIAG